eukprot:s386_g27.t1
MSSLTRSPVPSAGSADYALFALSLCKGQSGKTCAFMVPCLESLLRSGPPPAPRERRPKPMPCGLCLAPTRELAVQIQEESKKFAFDTGIRCCIINGGTDMREQRSELEGGCDVLVATPGRLSDMFERQYLSLGCVQFFILDEADRMLDMGFEPQVRQIVKNTDMGRWSTVRLQSMMFSATFAREVQVMARDFLNDYLFIKVGRVGSASELVTQKVVYADDGPQKVRALDKVIKDHLPNQGLCVVFVETKRGADALEMDLHQRNVSVAAIHGDRTQTEREEALAAFKSGANPILVATDVAARGLDIPNVSLVVNFDMPKQLDDYVHRIGRTGRAGRKGTAVAFVNEKCTYLHDLYDILVEAKQETPIWFEEMVRSARRMGGKGAARRDRFGGSDIRSTEETGKKEDHGDRAAHGKVVEEEPFVVSPMVADADAPSAAPEDVFAVAVFRNLKDNGPTPFAPDLQHLGQRKCRSTRSCNGAWSRPSEMCSDMRRLQLDAGRRNENLLMAYKEPVVLKLDRIPAPWEYCCLGDDESSVLELSRLWDKKGLLLMHQDEVEERSDFEKVRIFNALKSAAADRQMGDRTGRNSVEAVKHLTSVI